MDQIVELADRLGKAIAESPVAARLRAARKAQVDQPELNKLLDDYRTQSDKIAKLQAEKKPIEVQDKHRLRDLNDKLVSSETFKELTAAQMEYVDLMRRVNDALQKHLADTED